MRRNSICKLLYAVTAVLLVLFVITLAWDYSRYHTYSAPFYIYLLGRGVQFAIPGIIAFGIARSMKKKEYDIILFDLDGTLTESAEGITNSVIFALDKMGIKETDKEKLKAFVGPPLDESFMKYYGFDKEGAKEAIANYRIYYREKGIYEAPLYENVEKTLVQLSEVGKRLFVATSKPEVFAKNKEKPLSDLQLALLENNQVLQKAITQSVIKEMGYLFLAQEQQEEERYKRLDSLIRQQQSYRKEYARSTPFRQLRRIFEG